MRKQSARSRDSLEIKILVVYPSYFKGTGTLVGERRVDIAPADAGDRPAPATAGHVVRDLLVDHVTWRSRGTRFLPWLDGFVLFRAFMPFSAGAVRFCWAMTPAKKKVAGKRILASFIMLILLHQLSYISRTAQLYPASQLFIFQLKWVNGSNKSEASHCDLRVGQRLPDSCPLILDSQIQVFSDGGYHLYHITSVLPPRL